MDERWGDREEEAGWGGRRQKRAALIAKLQPTFYKNFLHNKATPVSRWVVWSPSSNNGLWAAFAACSGFMCASVCVMWLNMYVSIDLCMCEDTQLYPCTSVCCLYVGMPGWMPVCYLCVYTYRHGCQGEHMLVSTCVSGCVCRTGMYAWLHACHFWMRYIPLSVYTCMGILIGIKGLPYSSLWWNSSARLWRPLHSGWREKPWCR